MGERASERASFKQMISEWWMHQTDRFPFWSLTEYTTGTKAAIELVNFNIQATALYIYMKHGEH